MSEDSTPEARIEIRRERNVMAAAVSLLLPGLGHIYKGRYLTGAAILLLGAPTAVWMGVLLSLATLGLGLLIPVIFWAMTAVSAYYAEDRRAHHPMNIL